MLQMCHSIVDVGLALQLEKTIIKSYVRYTSFGSESTQLVVCEITRMVAKRTAVGVAANDWRVADVQRIVEALLGSMAEVNHYAVGIHFPYHFLSKRRYTVMGIASSCRVTDIVVAVVTKRYIDHTPLCEMLDVGQMSLQCQTVLYSEHYGLASLALVTIQVGWCARYAQVAAVVVDDGLYLVEYKVGVCGRTCNVEGNLAAESLANLRLWKICNHSDGIKPSLRHFVQVYEYAWITLVEGDSLWKEHWGIAMCVEGEYTVVKPFGNREVGGFPDYPFEYWQSVLTKTFRMPLYSEYAFMTAALKSLRYPIGSPCCYGEHCAAFGNGLMME